MTTPELADPLAPDRPDAMISTDPLPAPAIAPNRRRLALRLARLFALVALGALAIPLYAQSVPLANALSQQGGAFFRLLAELTALYVLACALVWRPWRAASAAADAGDNARGWRWAELAIILAVGVALRGALFGAPPALSPDAYRYAWDPYLIVHGISPYLHTPLDPALIHLRDHAIWPNLRYRNSPTIYPPAAQGLFLLAYAIAPLNILGVKGVIELCDALVCALTLALLWRGRLDLRRVILYWWAPLPILEFAFSAHVDAEAIVFTLAALLVASQRWRRARVVAGVLLGLATLTKLYPLLFVVALIRRRDYGLLVGLAATVALGYAPILALGAGGGGYLSTYFSQRNSDEGMLARILNLTLLRFTTSNTALIVAQGLTLALLCGLVALYRWRVGLRPEAAILAISAAWLSLSPHTLPWYVAALLPLLALYSVREARAWALWIATVTAPFLYILSVTPLQPTLFDLFFIAPLLIALSPLLTPAGRAAFVATARRLLARPTAPELRRLWAAFWPLAPDVADAQVAVGEQAPRQAHEQAVDGVS